MVKTYAKDEYPVCKYQSCSMWYLRCCVSGSWNNYLSLSKRTTRKATSWRVWYTVCQQCIIQQPNVYPYWQNFLFYKSNKLWRKAVFDYLCKNATEKHVIIVKIKMQRIGWSTWIVLNLQALTNLVWNCAYPEFFQNDSDWIDNTMFDVEIVKDNEVLVAHYDGKDFVQRKYNNYAPRAVLMTFSSNEWSY